MEDLFAGVDAENATGFKTERLISPNLDASDSALHFEPNPRRRSKLADKYTFFLITFPIHSYLCWKRFLD